MQLAVIADPHVHDTAFDPFGDGSGAFRTLADTIASTRVFNESVPAFRAALDDVVAWGIRHVLLLGDLTDDGQQYAVDCARGILKHYQDSHGLRFFACIGNHDLFARDGRHRAKRFLRPDGTGSEVASDPHAGATFAADMFCQGYAGFLTRFGDLGFMRQEGDLHWETPFGTTDEPSTRLATMNDAAEIGMFDASYLVEPIEGLWLLSLDANVYRDDPGHHDGATDFSDEGWNAALHHKPYLIGWMTDVAGRAERLGKQLLVFSHYPVLNPLPSSAEDEVALLGKSDFARRMPSIATRQAISHTGIKLHFSGHWHVNGTSSLGGLVNVAVPSLVGFPSGYKIVEMEASQVRVRTVAVNVAPGFDGAMPRYAAELSHDGQSHDALLQSPTYLDFLGSHLGALAVVRYLDGEWPAGLAARFRKMRMGDLAREMGISAAAIADLPMTIVIGDWYRLRRAGGMADAAIPSQRLALYRALVKAAQEPDINATPDQAELRLFLRMMGDYLDASLSLDVTVDLETGAAFPFNEARADAPSFAIPAPVRRP